MGSVGEHDGAFSSVLAFSLPYVWHTRILKGKYTYELGILPFQGKWQQAELHRQALEYNFPCATQRVTEQRAALGQSWTPFERLGPGEAVLSALYYRKGQLYARFYESKGGKAEFELRWLGRPVELTAVDLRERGQARLGRSARLGPWQIQTYAIEQVR
jgi:alpha-mannosidase